MAARAASDSIIISTSDQRHFLSKLINERANCLWLFNFAQAAKQLLCNFLKRMQLGHFKLQLNTRMLKISNGGKVNLK
jgi:hypothetical protein